MSKRYGKPLVSGVRLKWIKLRAGLTLLKISFSAYRNPSKAFTALYRLLGQRKRLHGNRKDHKIVRAGDRYYWSIYTPGFPSAAFRTMIRHEIRRAHDASADHIPLQTLILSVSSRCHYQCEHCYEGDTLSDRELLSMEDLSKILREAMELGVPHVQIGGGEPLLRYRDLINLLEQGRDSMEFWLSTSGYGFTLDMARALKLAGLTGANISLDHWEADKHNTFRKHPEAYRWAMEAVENCKATGIIPNLTLCVTHDMAHERHLMQYLTLARAMEVPFVRFLEARKAGNYKDKDVLLTSLEIRTVVNFVLKMNGSRSFRSYPIIQYPGYHQRKGGCYGSGNRYIYIDSAGNYHGCPFCRGAVGNIKETPLNDGIRLLREQGCHLFKTNIHA